MYSFTFFGVSTKKLLCFLSFSGGVRGVGPFSKKSPPRKILILLYLFFRRSYVKEYHFLGVNNLCTVEVESLNGCTVSELGLIRLD